MTTEQYLKALKKLRLKPTSKDASAALGLSIRQLIRIANHQAPVPKILQILLKMYQRHGIPKD